MAATTVPFLALGPLGSATARLAERLRQSVTVIRSRAGGGAGTIWQEDGLVITNHHVVPDDRAEVLTWDDRAFPATVEARDPEHDLAALRIKAEGLPVVDVADSDTVRPGQLVFAVGNPWGQRGHVTAGIIFSTGAAAENQVPIPGVIRADLALAPGNSGGPLADAAGRVLGINSMIAGGMAVAIPSNMVARFIAAGPQGRGYLGIVGVPTPVPHAIAASFPPMDGVGLLLTAVDDAGPAAQAGLQPGDMLLGVQEPAGAIPIVTGLRRLRAGHAIRLAILRGGRLHEVEALPVAKL